MVGAGAVARPFCIMPNKTAIFASALLFFRPLIVVSQYRITMGGGLTWRAAIPGFKRGRGSSNGLSAARWGDAFLNKAVLEQSARNTS